MINHVDSINETIVKNIEKAKETRLYVKYELEQSG